MSYNDFWFFVMCLSFVFTILCCQIPCGRNDPLATTDKDPLRREIYAMGLKKYNEDKQFRADAVWDPADVIMDVKTVEEKDESKK